MRDGSNLPRRQFLQICGGAAASLALNSAANGAASPRKPNVVFVFADQWRAQATGYCGDPNVKTPNLDRLASSSIRLTNAVSTCPVCSPYRGSLLTGRYPLTHGVFMNDVCLNTEAVSLAQAFTAAGYSTGYVGKWHVDGHGRSNFIPRERRQGFDFWRVLECTHNYNRSDYFGDENIKRRWEGYDAAAQTREAQNYIRQQAGKNPFLLVLSWGPPHDPYTGAPERFAQMYKPDALKLRPNIPPQREALARKQAAGYYAHCSTLDDCLGSIRNTLRETGIEDDTIFIFTSDHGDMLGSQGLGNKQVPYDESILVPFLIHYPRLGVEARAISTPIGSPDIMPTLLGLAGVEIPRTVEGLDFSGHLRGGASPAGADDAALIACYAPFGQWPRARGGKEYRGLRTQRHTYVRGLDGPWLLFDNQADPYQQKNLCNPPSPAAVEVQKDIESRLQAKLRQTHDDFGPAEQYIRKWGYVTDRTGTVPYTE